MPDIKTIADKADVIINGYAFTREDDGIHVLNLNSPDKAVEHCQSEDFVWVTCGTSHELRAITDVRVMTIECEKRL